MNIQWLALKNSPIARRCFVAGFTLTAAFGFLLNVATFAATRAAYQTDGFEVVGFPFVFQRFGGIAALSQFSPVALVADILILLLASVVVGIAMACWCDQTCPPAQTKLHLPTRPSS